MKISDLVMRTAKYDEDLAKDLAEYVRGRQYGLVYEASKPEFVRLWKKPIVLGDLVNILPPRGVFENTKDDTDPADVIYRVISANEKIASLRKLKTGETVEVPLDDIVAIARFDQAIYAGLRETGRIERGGNKPYHVVINGENYHGIQTLLYANQEKVDCIYIDPPYNSGAKDWKYNNNYVGEQDIYRHSKWLTFMEDRLKLAKKLLNPKDSVLIVTIDEKEYLRLGLLLEQIFPCAKIQMVSIVINPSGAKRDNLFSRSDEYAFIVLIGDATVHHPDGVSEETEVRWWYLKRTDYASRRGTVKGGIAQFYPIYVDNKTMKIIHIGEPLLPDQPISDVPKIDGATAVFPIREDGVEMNWGLTGPSLQKLIDENVVRVSTGSAYMPYVFQYLSANYTEKIAQGRWAVRGLRADGTKIVVETKGKVTRATTTWKSSSHDAGQYGTSILHTLIGNREFAFPKSLYAVEDTLKYFLIDKPNALVVDFFAGSGTTCHAVMRLNHLDGGCRRCISITNNEVSSSEIKRLTERKLRQGDDEWEKIGICKYITIPRIMAAITGIMPDGKPIDSSKNYEVIRETYVEDEDIAIMSRKTGKEIKNRHVYVKKKLPDPSVLDSFPISEGFKENAIFFDIEYLEPSVVSADLAFDEIAPILWLRGGGKGGILKRHKGFVIGETYAVLFSHKYKRRFIEAIENNYNIKTVFIVTDIAERYRDMCIIFPERDVVQLYDSYLRSFEINAMG